MIPVQDEAKNLNQANMDFITTKEGSTYIKCNTQSLRHNTERE